MAQKLTKLDAVNIILSNVGQAPVSTIDNDNPMVSMAVNILDEVAESMQSEGWSFNYEKDYPFIPDINGEIQLPTNVIRLDADELSRLDPVIRQGKLYDKREHTYKFTDKVDLDVTWLLEFEDLPQPAKQYAAIRAANLFAGRAVGSAEQVRFGEREESAARATLIEYECQQGDYNYLGTRTGQNYPTYRPYSVIARY